MSVGLSISPTINIQHPPLYTFDKFRFLSTNFNMTVFNGFSLQMAEMLHIGVHYVMQYVHNIS